MIPDLVRKVKIALPGACGELVQGIYMGSPCLVSCPIDMMVEIEVSVSTGTGKVLLPESMPKTERAVQRALIHFKRSDIDVVVRRSKALPEARGYASSTADILATLFGLARSLQESISAKEATKLAISIEPTDSLAWEDLTLLSYRDGEVIQPLGKISELDVLILDWCRRVDTLTFNSAAHNGIPSELVPVYNEVFSMLFKGIAERDVDLMGQAASLSARMHQKILFKPELDEVFKLAEDVDSPGVCVAHSGSLIGVLLKTGESKEKETIRDYIVSRLPGEPLYSLHAVVEGGPRYISDKSKCLVI